MTPSWHPKASLFPIVAGNTKFELVVIRQPAPGCPQTPNVGTDTGVVIIAGVVQSLFHYPEYDTAELDSECVVTTFGIRPSCDPELKATICPKDIFSEGFVRTSSIHWRQLTIAQFGSKWIRWCNTWTSKEYVCLNDVSRIRLGFKSCWKRGPCFNICPRIVPNPLRNWWAGAHLKW